MKPVLAFYHPDNQHPDWLQSYRGGYRLIGSKTELLTSFSAHLPIVGFCAAGILIRQLASVLGDKWHEPPVLVVSGDEKSGHIIPLLGANHGGNKLAATLGALWQLTPIISTATEKLGFSPDDPPQGWKIRHGRKSKAIAKKLLQGKKIAVDFQNKNLMAALGIDTAANLLTAAGNGDDADMRVGAFLQDEHREILQLCPPLVTLGIGAIRHCDFSTLERLVLTNLEEARLSVESVAGIASIDLKDNEAALHQLAEKYDVPLRFFSADTLAKITVPNPSAAVHAETGTASVSEAAALLLAGENAQLYVEKQKNADATCALALADSPLRLDRLPGRKAGILRVVGLGPGAKDFRLPAASHALAAAEVIIGYGLYLDLIRAEFASADIIALPLGHERERAKAALDCAMQGKNTALVCSGDPGIYALASLVMEQSATQTHPPLIEVIPGITAMQMLAARIGAPLGHDFCAISLSDLLTPAQTIRARVTAAAHGDFVTAFYNPQSQKRRTLLNTAIDILREYRSGETPVIIGRNLARADEHITVTRLADFDSEKIDMFCLVMVGSSQTQLSVHRQIFTPRGYASKAAIPPRKTSL